MYSLQYYIYQFQVVKCFKPQYQSHVVGTAFFELFKLVMSNIPILVFLFVCPIFMILFHAVSVFESNSVLGLCISFSCMILLKQNCYMFSC